MTSTTDPRALVERLREDVFYGEERMHKMQKHNPLHLEAADAITAALDENDRLREALQSIAHDGEGWLNRKRTKIVAREALEWSDQ